jgi:hypothetical protein
MRWNARIRKSKGSAQRSETSAMYLDGITLKSRVNVYSHFFPRTPMVWDGGRWTPIRHETFPAVPSTNLFDFSL